jgi:pilus assembly protein CpaB
MRFGNVITLGAALFCATAASFLARSWMNEQAADRVVVAATQEATPPATRPIVVAARNLEPGEKLTPDMLRTVAWPSDTALNGAFDDPALLAQPGQERTVLTAITENEPLLEQRLYKVGEGSLAANLTGSMNAVTIRVNDVAGVAGFVQTGDRVDIFMTSGGRSAEGAAAAEKPSVIVLLKNVRVLATDQTTERKGQVSPPKAVTLEVKTEDAQKLILASTVGELSLALRRSHGDVPTATRLIGADDLIERTASIPRATPGKVIGVTRGSERQEYVVQSGPSKYLRAEVARQVP